MTGTGTSDGTNQDETQLYQDLKGFLVAERTDLRLAATEAVLQVASQQQRDGDKLVQHGLVKPLAQNFNHSSAQVGVNALQGMLLLLSTSGSNSNNHQCLEELLQAGGINRVVEVILSSSPSSSTEHNNKDDNDNPLTLWKKRVNFALAILANLTRDEQGAVELVGKTLPEKAVAPQELTPEEKEKLPTKPLLELMLSRFLRQEFCSEETTTKSNNNDNQLDEDDMGAAMTPDTAAQQDSNHNDPYQHFAAVLMNCTQTEAARKFVLKLRRQNDNDTNPTCVFAAILPQLKSANPIRRRGIAGTIRNCCLETDSAWWFLNEIKVTTHLLYPLAGPEELDLDEKKGLAPDLWLEGPDKVREPDATTRLYLVETLLLLCASGRRSRETLRLARVYVILKWADMVEESEAVSERINECVQFLRRDEEGTQEGSSDLLVAESLKRPTTSVQISMLENDGEDDDYDAVD